MTKEFQLNYIAITLLRALRLSKESLSSVSFYCHDKCFKLLKITLETTFMTHDALRHSSVKLFILFSMGTMSVQHFHLLSGSLNDKRDARTTKIESDQGGLRPARQTRTDRSRQRIILTRVNIPFAPPAMSRIV